LRGRRSGCGRGQDWQKRETRFWRNRNFDVSMTFGPFGVLGVKEPAFKMPFLFENDIFHNYLKMIFSIISCL
jgi:hypothetical protein